MLISENRDRIIISRTDKIGDVVLTLPLTGYLKKVYPKSYIIFLGNSYVRPVLETCEYIDEIVEWDKIQNYSLKEQVSFFRNLDSDTIIHVYPNRRVAKLAFLAKIRNRVGTSHRWYHYLFCNRLVNLGRKNSDKHEVELNFELLKPMICCNNFPDLKEIPHLYGMKKISSLPERLKEAIVPDKFNLIIHPKSKGSAREWSLNNYADLIKLLPSSKVNVIIAGTEYEGKQIEWLLKTFEHRIVNLTGKMTLSEYISLIYEADGLLACSTGPLHIAAALGKYAIGLYSPMRPIFPKRWKPIGNNAYYFVLEKECNKCKKSNFCECIENIKPEWVYQKIMSLPKIVNMNK